MVVSLSGEWDIYRSGELQEALKPAYSEPEVVLDLTGAKYVTSTLIGALIIAQRHREQSGMERAALAVKSAFVRRLLNATGVDSVYPIFETVDEAL